MKRITIGTRASKLAMIQTSEVIERLHQQWPDLEISIEQIRTHGDHIIDVPLTQIGGDGVFVTEIERALSEKRIDLAVHSLKDLPTVQPAGLCLAIIGPREDVRDVLIWSSEHKVRESPSVYSRGDPLRSPWEYTDRSSRSVYSRGGPLRSPWPNNPMMPHSEHIANLRIGTCSLRRTAQVLALYPNAQILPLRGNVDTRLRKLDGSEYDAIVLAAAGLHRLGIHENLLDRITYLPIDSVIPAPGQGALALEMRDEPEMRALIAPLNDPVAQETTSAERIFMRRLGAGCYLPVAAHGQITNGILTLQGLVISLDGQHQVRVSQSMPWTLKTTLEQAEQLGIQLAEQALAEGAADIINAMNDKQIVLDPSPLANATTNNESSQPARRLVVAPLAGAMPRDLLTTPRDPTAMLSPQPLKGKSILVTRTREQAGALSERLRTLGATSIEFPTIRIVPPQDWAPFDNALRYLCMADSRQIIYGRGAPLRSPWSPSSPQPSLSPSSSLPPSSSPSSNYYDWLIFTSANGVNICIERLRHLGYAPSAISNLRIAAIGPATAAALAQYSIIADLVPDEYIAEGIAAAIIEDAVGRGESLEGKRILLARAAEARKVLVTELQQAGAIVDEVAAYRTLPAASDDAQGRNVLRMLQDHQIDIVTFTSSSTVHNFIQWLKDCEHSTTGSLTNLVTRDPHLKIACIGPITSQTARELGLDVHIEAKEFTIEGLVEAIIQHEEKS